jgi:hypothetical protein
MAYIEVTSRRGRKEKHYYDADTNRFQAVITIHDQHYKDDLDEWQDVDESFVDDTTPGFNKKCDKTRHSILMGNGGNRRWYPRRNVSTEYVDITGMQYWDGNSWRNLNLPTPVWMNNKTEWDMTNLYASVTNIWKRIKTEFILKNSNAYTRLRFTISFTGLIYNSTTGELTSTTDGLVWGYIDKPKAFCGAIPDEIIIPVTQTYDGTYIEWSVDTTDAIYPIYVDPTFTDGYGGNVDSAYDTFVWWEYPDDEQGSSLILYFRQLSGTLGDYNSPHALLKFDLTSLVGKTIGNANLYVHRYTSDTWWGQVYMYVNRIYSGNSAWTEERATWNYANEGTSTRWAGDVGSDGGDDAGCSSEGTDLSATKMGTYDLGVDNDDAEGTEYNIVLGLTDFALLVSGNYGVVGWGSTGYPGVWSSDYSTTGWRPKLVVVYEGEETDININISPENSSQPGVKIYTP